MDALGRSSGSSDPTRSRLRTTPPIASPATRPARGRRECSSHRFLDRHLLSLPSQHPLYNTTVSQTLRQPLRSRGENELLRIPFWRSSWSGHSPKFGASLVL